MIATIVIALIVAGLLALAVRYLAKNGVCAACEDHKACEAARKKLPADGCGGKCSACRYYEMERKAAARHTSGI